MGNNKLIASFGWNHEGLGHVSRLLGVHGKIRTLSDVETMFFVEHKQDLIEDYQVPQMVLPSHKGSLLGDEWWSGKALGVSDDKAREISEFAVDVFLKGKDGMMLFDVVVHRAMYEWALAHNWPQAIIYRERKDIGDPVPWISKVAPGVKTVFWIGRPGFDEVRDNIHVIGVNNVVRKRTAENSVWPAGTEDAYKILITAGGGGHADAEKFLYSAVEAVSLATNKTNRKIFIKVVLGPYYKGKIVVPKDCRADVDITPYLGPEFSQYKDTSLIISQGGYNSFNEARAEGVPVVIVPAARKLDDQGKRAKEGSTDTWQPYVSDGTMEDIAQGILSVMKNQTIQNKNILDEVTGAEEIAKHVLQILEEGDNR